MKLKQALKTGLAAAALTVASVSAMAAPYVVGGAAQTVIPGSQLWAWDGDYMASFRAALEDPANFGPTGTVNRAIQTVTMGTVDATTLAGVDMFVGTWIEDGEAASMSTAVVDYFLSGGDLFLLQDDSSHDGLGQALGITTTQSTGTVSNGGAPLFDGPFGVATNVQQFYSIGQLDPVAIAAKNGHVGGLNASGQVTSAYWRAGEYAPGAGSLFVIADIDMIASTTSCGQPVCGASYSPLNANGIYALNTFSFLQENGGTPPIPEPGTYALLLAGLGLGAASRLRSRR